MSAFAVRIARAPASKKERARVAMQLARALSLPLGDARALVDAAPSTTPRRMDEHAARELLQALAGAGADVEAVTLGAGHGTCATHDGLDAATTCASCGGRVCSVCSARAGASLCGACLAKQRRRRAFRNARISVLLGVLAVVLLYAWNDVHRRRERTDWTRTLNVALVLLRRGPVDPAAVDQLSKRAGDLELRLADEMRRYRKGPPPFGFHVAGPVDITSPPPSAGGDDVLALARHQYDLWRYLARVDAEAGVDEHAFDSRVYLVIQPPHSRREMVEGESEEGGRIGVVSVDLGDNMVDFALFVATHELMHTLGATDKYDATGRAVVPQGLGNPAQVPLYPQHAAEVMARNVVLAPGRERPPDSLAELAVGRWTAREIGWLR